MISFLNKVGVTTWKIIVVLILLLQGITTIGQSIADLEQSLEQAQSSEERMEVYYQLGLAWRRDDLDKSIDYTKQAFQLANDQGNYGLAAQSSFLLGESYIKQRNKRNAEVWFRSALKFAKQAGDADLIVKSVKERGKLAARDRNFKRAAEIYEEAFEFFSTNGSSISDLQRKFNQQKARLDKDRRQLEEERSALMSEIDRLTLEKKQLSSEKKTLTKKQVQLEEEKKQVEAEIDAKEEALADVELKKRQAERQARVNKRRVAELTIETIADSLALAEAERESAEAKLQAATDANIRNIVSILAGVVFLLALLFYARFRSKQKSAK